MSESDPKHPPPEQLQALVLGLVEEVEATALGSHVWNYDVCLGSLERLSDHGDPFLSKLRAVHTKPRPDAFQNNTLAEAGARDTDAAQAPAPEPVGAN